MNSDTPDPDRRLLPRFRTSESAAAAGILNSLSDRRASEQNRPASADFERLMTEWHRAPTLEAAVELTISANVLGRSQEVREAAELILKKRAEIAPRIVMIARDALTSTPHRLSQDSEHSGFPAEAEVRRELAALKNRLSRNPRNAIAWMDKAHLQTALGQIAAAERAVAMAVGIAPNNRFVLRCASRFHVHAGSKEEGLSILRRSEALRSDPWIMSAEVALSTLLHKPPKSFHQARSLIDNDSLHPWHTAELNGALGTLAIYDRSIGKPGQFFRRSLRHPTENALAQAQWFANNNQGFQIPPALFGSNNAYEAKALKARSERRWKDVLDACRGWAAVDPVSSRPLVLGAFVAEVALHDGAAALEFTSRWTTIEPANPTAWNNQAVALAYMGRLDDARAAFDKVSREDSDDYPDAVYLATQGLLAYRSGDPVLGRSLYLQAAETFRARQDVRLRVLALWHLLREEARLGSAGVEQVADALWARAKDASVPELNQLREEIIARTAHPGSGFRIAAPAKRESRVPGLPDHFILTFLDKE